MDPITIYSMVICPFAQRTRIHLDLLGLPHRLENLDICAPRPDWFLALNPAGQVPVIVNGDDVVCDSGLIAEYLQEIAETPLPFGRDPAARARQRGLLRWVDGPFLHAMYLLLAARTPDERKERIDASLATFRRLDAFLADEAQGEWVDDGFGMVETQLAPFLLRYEVVAYYQDFEVPAEAGLERFVAWRDRILAEPVVRRTAEPVPDLIKMYEDYTLGSYNGAVPPGRERSSLDLRIPVGDRPMPERAASVR